MNFIRQALNEAYTGVLENTGGNKEKAGKIWRSTLIFSLCLFSIILVFFLYAWIRWG